MVNTAKVYAAFELRHSLDAAGRIRLYGFWMTVEAWYIPLYPIWCWKIETSCFMSTHDDSLLWIYIYCCVIFKRNYWPLLQLSDSHVVSSISNSYRDAVTGVHVQLPHMIITSAPVHTLHIAVKAATQFACLIWLRWADFKRTVWVYTLWILLELHQQGAWKKGLGRMFRQELI